VNEPFFGVGEIQRNLRPVSVEKWAWKWLNSGQGTGNLIGNGEWDMLHKNWLKTGFTVLALAGMASAHLTDGSLSVKGGETFAVNEAVTLKWNVSVLHDGKMDIDFSKDGGTTWISVKAGYQAVSGDNSFKWTVPNEPTVKGKIRVCLGAGASCADVKVSSPGASAPYSLVSPVFTVSGTSAVLARSEAGVSSLRFNPETRNVDVSFGLVEAKNVTLQAFDTQGRLLATLVQGDFAAGNHKLSLFSNRLDASGSSLVFKLKVGNQVQSHTWTMVR